MAIKKKKQIDVKLTYCPKCEELGHGMFCTGLCRKKQKKGKK